MDATVITLVARLTRSTVIWTVDTWSTGRAARGHLDALTGNSPAAFAPFVELGAFRAEGGVVAVAGVEPGVVRELVEDPRLHVVEQRREVLRRGGLADAAGEQRVTLTVNNRGDGQRPSCGTAGRVTGTTVSSS
jgi:hypothetical protein